ncbi:acyl-CoA synthetase (AMP-forming)/AMP-acid ligase II [Nocardia transvalensis]|uniref:Acyl-CoA synthetase (AMP-forming)/AMP-acid ligase II n=1 Tax=Nocardia transvalensis TaxID=37333 RepID=A0A7W9PIH0_9NOCA|nr:AMP-binding protein [Nocardia transvalensis]MBB5916677.1 acyl-CoA synthetase (AMP-forming)/AMP-acid ligase II [Nocardia transvalensis]
MSADLSHSVRQWGSAIPAVLSSGMLAPVGPRKAAALARSFHRYGPTPATLLAATAIRHPDKVAIIDDSGELTYRHLQQRAEAIAAALYAACATPPRSVGIICRNHRGFAEAMAAGAQLGAELIFINTELPAAQLQAILARHNPDVLIYDDEYAVTVEEANFTGLRVLAWCDRPAELTGLPTLDDLAARSHPAPPRVRHPVKLTLLTSGTTGLAKGVPRAVKPRAIVLLTLTAMAILRLRSTDRVLVAPPMFHGFGLLSLLGPLALGGTAVCRRRFDAATALDDIARHQVTVVMAVPVMLQRLLAAPGLTDHRTARSALRVIVTGAAPISPATISKLIEAFGPILVNGYGSTEAGLVTIATPADLVAAPDTAGRTSLGVSVRILRTDRTEAAPGETGEIFVRSGLEYTGYTPDPAGKMSAKEVIDGHVSTGDMGHFDVERRLFIDGRADDMIVSGGENIFPGEVEDRLAAHPDITDAVVIGVPDTEFGQVLNAFVVLAPGALAPSQDALKQHVREGLERYKVPKRFVVLDEIPRNASGKVLRAKLHAMAGS